MIGRKVVGAAGQEALRRAARDGRVEALAALLAAGVDPALPGADGRTALQLAARAGHVACVHALLPPLANRTDLVLRALNVTRSAQVAEILSPAVSDVLRGPAGEDVIKQAVRDGRCDVALALMAVEPQEEQVDSAVLLSQPGANATCVEPILNRVFDIAEKKEIAKRILDLTNSTEIVEALGKTDPNLLLTVAGVSSSTEAVKDDRCFMVRALLTAGVGADTDDAQKALEAAVESAEVECVRALRSGGVSPLAGERWERELLAAAQEGKRNALVALLAAGVRIDAKDHYGKTPLILASEQGHLDVVRELLKVNAKVNISDDFGETALILSSRHGHFQVVRLLLAANAEVNAINVIGRTALFYASFDDRINALRELLKANANVNISDIDGYTALMMSARFGYLEIVRLLLAANADVNAKDNQGNSALIMSAMYDHLEIVRLLLAANADVNAKNIQGKTALDYASEYNKDLVKQELLKFKNV